MTLLQVTNMTQGNFTKLTKKKNLQIYYVNPYDSDEPFYRTGFLVTDKVDTITRITLRNKLKFVAIPSIECLSDNRNMGRLIALIAKVRGSYGTIINDTGKKIMTYREEDLTII